MPTNTVTSRRKEGKKVCLKEERGYLEVEHSIVLFCFFPWEGGDVDSFVQAGVPRLNRPTSLSLVIRMISWPGLLGEYEYTKGQII
jgi:hypothetical protein